MWRSASLSKPYTEWGTLHSEPLNSRFSLSAKHTAPTWQEPADRSRRAPGCRSLWPLDVGVGYSAVGTALLPLLSVCFFRLAECLRNGRCTSCRLSNQLSELRFVTCLLGRQCTTRCYCLPGREDSAPCALAHLCTQLSRLCTDVSSYWMGGRNSLGVLCSSSPHPTACRLQGRSLGDTPHVSSQGAGGRGGGVPSRGYLANQEPPVTAGQ